MLRSRLWFTALCLISIQHHLLPEFTAFANTGTRWSCWTVRNYEVVSHINVINTWWPISRATQNAINFNGGNHKVRRNHFSSVFLAAVCKFHILCQRSAANSNTCVWRQQANSIDEPTTRIKVYGKTVKARTMRDKKQLPLHCKCGYKKQYVKKKIIIKI